MKTTRKSAWIRRVPSRFARRLRIRYALPIEALTRCGWGFVMRNIHAFMQIAVTLSLCRLLSSTW
jgi:hypothetical protein